MITDRQWAYLAGLIDGDGSIMVRRRDKPSTINDRARNISFELKVTIGGQPKHLATVRAVYGGGNLYIRKREGQRHLAEWRVVARQARRVLEGIEPYLMLKQRQARIALAMPRPIARWGITPELRAAQEQARVDISNLNSAAGRGKVVRCG